MRPWLMVCLIHSMIAQGNWQRNRSANWLDGASHFYRCYECADGKYIAVGALEPQFFAELVAVSGVEGIELDAQFDTARWPEQQTIFAKHFKQRSRDDWAALFEGTDACVAPVLEFGETAQHPFNAVREAYHDVDGVMQARAAPRFSRSLPPMPDPPRAPGADTVEVLKSLGFDDDQLAEMRAKGTIT